MPGDTDQLARVTIALAERYRLERELGQGGMATVYLAHDLKHDRDVALKVLRPELAAVLGAERFLQEIRITARLDHPHILTLIDSGESDGFLWYVVPYVRGESLRHKLTRERQLGLAEALAITKQVAGALEYAHRQGVIHRDVKPENILLQEGEAVLTDFGIALAVKQAGGNRLTESGLSLGTPQYMSPEQATGERGLDARTDVYSLAAVLYEMLAGEAPHTGVTAQAVIAKLLTERSTRLRVVRDTVPEGVDAGVARALAKVPADRFESAEAFVAALERPSPVTERKTERQWWRDWRKLTVAGVLAVASLGGVWLLSPRRGPAPAPVHTQLTFTGRAENPAISPEGRYVAYVLDNGRGGSREDLAHVMVQQVANGEARQVGDPVHRVGQIRFARNGSGLIYEARPSRDSVYGVYWVPLLSGSPRVLAKGSGMFGQSLDGSALLLLGYADRTDTLMIVNDFEGQTRAKTIAWPPDSSRPRGIYDGEWGPEGRRVAVVGNEGGLSIISLDGVARGRIQTCTGLVSCQIRSPRWSHSEDALYYLDGAIRSAAAVMKARINSRTGRPRGAPRPLLTGLPMGDYVDVTDDGTRLVYDRWQARTHLWRVSLPADPSGALMSPARVEGSGEFDRNAAISRDGRWLAFVRGAYWGHADIYVQPVAGGATRRITSLDAQITEVRWSPDGTQLAFSASTGTNQPFALMVVSLADRQARRVGTWPTGSPLHDQIAWVDDTSIVYVGVAKASVGNRPLRPSLRVVNPSSGRERRIALPEKEWDPDGVSATPDGESVLVRTWLKGKWRWIVVSITGRTATQSLGFESSYFVAWPISGRILALGGSGDTSHVWSTATVGGKPVLHARLPVACADPSFAPGGSFLVCEQWISESDIWMVDHFDPDVP